MGSGLSYKIEHQVFWTFRGDGRTDPKGTTWPVVGATYVWCSNSIWCIFFFRLLLLPYSTYPYILPPLLPWYLSLPSSLSSVRDLHGPSFSPLSMLSNEDLLLPSVHRLWGGYSTSSLISCAYAKCRRVAKIQNKREVIKCRQNEMETNVLPSPTTYPSFAVIQQPVLWR